MYLFISFYVFLKSYFIFFSKQIVLIICSDMLQYLYVIANICNAYVYMYIYIYSNKMISYFGYNMIFYMILMRG